MTWKLWIDDDALTPGMEHWRYAPDFTWRIALNSKMAKELVKELGTPKYISFDHDLGILDGKNDTSMVFLKWLVKNYHDHDFEYDVHSQNPNGRDNIISYIESWKKSKL